MPDIEAMLDNCQRMVGELPSVAEHRALQEANADLLAALKELTARAEPILGLLPQVKAARAAIAKAEAAL